MKTFSVVKAGGLRVIFAETGRLQADHKIQSSAVDSTLLLKLTKVRKHPSRSNDVPWSSPPCLCMLGSFFMGPTFKQVPKMLGELRHSWAPEAFVVSFKLETDDDILIQKVCNGTLCSFMTLVQLCSWRLHE